MILKINSDFQKSVKIIKQQKSAKYGKTKNKQNTRTN